MSRKKRRSIQREEAFNEAVDGEAPVKLPNQKAAKRAAVTEARGGGAVGGKPMQLGKRQAEDVYGNPMQKKAKESAGKESAGLTSAASSSTEKKRAKVVPKKLKKWKLLE